MLQGQNSADRLDAALAGGLQQLMELGKPAVQALQAYINIGSICLLSKTLPYTSWEASQAVVASHAVDAFLSLGCLVSLAMGCGSTRAVAMGLQPQGGGTLWEMLAALCKSTVATADDDFLLNVVKRTDCRSERTGVDTVDALVALALCPAVPGAAQEVAFGVLLSRPALLLALSAAGDEETSDETLEETEATAADLVEALESVGVRYELANALSSGVSTPCQMAAWGMLVAHLLRSHPEAPGQQKLVQCLKDSVGLVPLALNGLLAKLPLESTASNRRGSVERTTPAAVFIQEDTTPAGFSLRLKLLGYPSSSGGLQGWASLLYAGMLRALPVPCRLWFADIRDRSISAALEKYTAASVSPALLSAEFAAVEEMATNIGLYDKFTIRASPAAREVSAALEVEDGHLMELAVKLPACFPLRAAEVDCKRSVGVNDSQLRKWLLSITAFLRYRNGAVAGAIRMWKRNVDSEFEGKEECLICYSIVQPSTGDLPRLACRTCRKRFHGACIFKWFRSSSKSTCPHCQSPW